MKIFIHISCLLMLCSMNVTASSTRDSNFVDVELILKTASGDLLGTLATPKEFTKSPLVLFIAGSGPTDRNGNNSMMKNDSYLQLARGLAGKGIASVRYDKRGIGGSGAAMKSEAELRFEDYVEDAKAWITMLKKDNRFSEIVVLGHSEGSLIGMLAAKSADKFISLAGPGRPAGELIKEQLSEQPAMIKDNAFPILDSLRNGHLVKTVNPMLESLFRKSVQPYMISWFRYDPREEIKKLTIPVLIIQGTADLQVKESDAKLLSLAKPPATLLIVNNMNHVLKIINGGREENIRSYNDNSIQIPDELVEGIAKFVKP